MTKWNAGTLTLSILSLIEEFSQAATHDDPCAKTEARRGMDVQTPTWVATNQADDVQCRCDGFKRTVCKRAASLALCFRTTCEKEGQASAAPPHMSSCSFKALSLAEGHFNQLASTVWIICQQDLAHDSTPMTVYPLLWNCSVPPSTPRHN